MSSGSLQALRALDTVEDDMEAYKGHLQHIYLPDLPSCKEVLEAPGHRPVLSRRPRSRKAGGACSLWREEVPKRPNCPAWCWVEFMACGHVRLTDVNCSIKGQGVNRHDFCAEPCSSGSLQQYSEPHSLPSSITLRTVASYTTAPHPQGGVFCCTEVIMLANHGMMTGLTQALC